MMSDFITGILVVVCMIAAWAALIGFIKLAVAWGLIL